MIREFKHERTARNGCMTEAKDSALSIVGMHLFRSVGALSIKQRQEMNSGTRAGWLRAWVIKPDRVGTCRDSVVVSQTDNTNKQAIQDCVGIVYMYVSRAKVLM